MAQYEAKVISASRELTVRERIRAKDLGNAVALDKATDEGSVVIDFDYYAELQVHNERSQNPDYTKIVIVDKAGNKFVTGSESFKRALIEILEETEGEDIDVQIEAYKRQSKNYAGKAFITCSLV